MNFPDSYYEDEVRDGFYVSSLIKRSWAAQLEVLEDIDKVCKKHNIKYFAEWGTLLGVVRHGGFIPWDDDLDICMFREDYEKFSKVALDEMPSVYRLLNYEHMGENDEIFDDYLTRVHSGFSIRTDKEYLDKFHGFPFIVGIDIFPLDYLPRDQKDIELYKNQLILLNSMAKSANTWDETEKDRRISEIENVYNIKLDRTKPLRKQIFCLADEMCGMFKSKDADYVTFAALRTEKDYQIPKSCYDDVIYMPFENIKIPVPVGYDTILKIKYGDYMKPVRSGGGHEYPFYKRQMELCNQFNIGLYSNYVFSKDELGRKKERELISLKEITTNIISLFEQANNSIFDAIKREDWSSILALLEDCQDGAIALGQKIEAVKGDETQTVRLLERYCEVLYSLHEYVSCNGYAQFDEAEETLTDICNQLKNCTNREIVSRKEVVFLPYRASAWNAFESVWQAACQDEDSDVYVVPVPYFQKNLDGSLGNMIYEGDKYPSYVQIQDYNTFDFGLHHPDKIFIQNPYDEYNAAISVHPFFYAKNLKEFTDCLIYIPYFLIDEIKDDDERGKITLDYFCTVPGIVHADKVIVQSEEMKHTYIEALVKFAGEETRIIWENKILGIGSPILDSYKKRGESLNYPKEWDVVLFNKSGNKKKVIVYGNSLGVLLEHGNKMLKKIEKVLATFKDNQDEVSLIWRPQPEIRASIEYTHPELYQSFEVIRQNYISEGWGIYDENLDLEIAVSISDAYYGDTGSIVQQFKKYSLPVMIQNVDF